MQLSFHFNQAKKLGVIGIVFISMLGTIPLTGQSIGAGKTIDFLGRGSFATHPHDNRLTLGNTGTIEVWIHPTNHTPFAGIVHKGNETDWEDENYSLQFWESDGTVAMSFGRESGEFQLLKSNTKLSTGKTYHIAATWDASEVKLYINGQLDASTAFDFVIHQSSSSIFTIGSQLHFKYNDTYQNMPFDGYIDEVRIWGATLSPQEIQEWMCKKVTSSHQEYSNLRAYYRFDERNNNDLTVQDYGPNNMNCKISHYDDNVDVYRGWSRDWSFFPLGDKSAFIVNGSDISLTSAESDQIALENVSGNFDYLAIMEITESPNYTAADDVENLFTEHYWYVWSTNNAASYDLVYNYNSFQDEYDENSFKLLKRSNALISEWTQSFATQAPGNNQILDNNVSLNQQYILGGSTTPVPTGNYYVRPDGDNNDDGRTPATAWQTIQYASVQNVQPGDTIFIAAGEYSDNAVISHSGTADEPILYHGDISGDYFGSYADAGAITMNTDSHLYGIYIGNQSNVIFKNIDVNQADYAGFFIKQAKNIKIEGSQIINNGMSGIYATECSGHIKIDNCDISNGRGSGIYFTNNTDNISLDITNTSINIFHNGIYMDQTNANLIINNDISNVNNLGLYIVNTSSVTNIINNNLSGINAGYGFYFDNSIISKVNDNILTNIQNDAVFSTNCTISSIDNNVISSVGTGGGILCEKTNISSINNNQINGFSDNAITAEGNSQNLTIADNTIYESWKDGIAVRNYSGGLNITGNYIHDTRAGIILENATANGNYTIQKNKIHNTRGGDCLYINNARKLTIQNNLLYNAEQQWDSDGIHIATNSNYAVNIINNTIYHTGKRGIYGNRVNGIWKNNIIANHNTGDWEFAGIGVSSGNPTLSYNCLHNNSTNYSGISEGTNSLSNDPLFVDVNGSDNTLGTADDDFHIKSEYGSYHGGNWSEDNATSPCLDAGDPGDSYNAEPDDNGKRINMGRYGNTSQASLSGDDNGSNNGGNPGDYTYTVPGETWVLIGPPVQPVDSDPMAVYGDDFGNEMPFDNNHWSFIRWRTEDDVSEYYEFGDGTIYQPENPRPGLGHFLWQDYNDPVVVDVDGTPLESDVYLDIAAAPEADWDPPAPGFNMLANPYTFPIDWSNTGIQAFGVVLTPLWLADLINLISMYAYTWNHEAGQYEIVAPQYGSNADRIEPWQGFWFVQRTKSPDDIQLHIPYQPDALSKALSTDEKKINSLKPLGPQYNIKPAGTFSDWQWFLKLSVYDEKHELSDTENGIGVAENAVDGEDGWDAFEFNSMNDEFVQLTFPHEDGKTFTYDLHDDFSDEDQWTFYVKTNEENLGKTYQLMWPFLNTVPGNLKFSLLSDDESVLIEDLSTQKFYQFQMNENQTTFRILAKKIEDDIKPSGKFMFTQNPILENELTIFVIPSEPVAEMSITLNNELVTATKLSHNSNIYYFTHFLKDQSSLDMAAEFVDFSGNDNRISTQISLAKISPEKPVTLNQQGITLSIPSYAARNPTTITLCAENLDIDGDSKNHTEAIKIGPDNFTFDKPVVLQYPVSGRADLYQYNAGNWEFVQSGDGDYQIEETGIYQFFNSNNQPPAEQVWSPKDFVLKSVFPNPFNATAKIRFQILETTDLKITIYDLRGNKINQLVHEQYTAGYYTTEWQGTDEHNNDVPSGTYLLVIESNQNHELKKITYLK